MDILDYRKQYSFADCNEQDAFMYAIIGIHDNVMNILTERFNTINKLKYSRKFFEVFFGKWVFTMITHLYIQLQMGEGIANHNTKQIIAVKNKFQKNSLDLRGIIFEEFYSVFLNQEIKKYRDEYDAIQNNNSEIDSAKDEKSIFEEYIDVGKSIAERLEKDVTHIPRNGLSMIASHFKYLMNDLEYKKMVALCNENNIIIAPNMCNMPKSIKNLNIRKEIFKVTDEMGYILSLIMHFFEQYFPIGYIECFKFLNDELKRDDYYKKKEIKRFFVLDYTHCENILFDLFIARQVELNNAKLFSIQHGGEYGMLRLTGIYEILVSDGFITYGWQSNQYATISNLTLLRNPFRRKYSDTSENVLLISTYEPRERFYIAGVLSYCGYRESIVEFLNKISSYKHINIEWRSYNCRYSSGTGDSQRDYVESNLTNPQKVIIDVPGSVYERQRMSNLIVVDHIGTTMLETIGADTPTVLYFDPKQYNISDEFAYVLNILERVGMYHKSGEAAAEYVSGIINNIETWWNEPERLEARNIFKEHFSISNEDIVSDYISLFCGEKCKKSTKYKIKFSLLSIRYRLIEYSLDIKALKVLRNLVRGIKNGSSRRCCDV